MATSKLQIAVGDLLDKSFPQFTIRENHRPDWLMSPDNTKMELDFFIEEIKTALEVQGRQHYEFTPHFHKTIEEFEKRKLYDSEKKNLCDGAGIKLIEIFCLMDAIIVIKTIEDDLPERQNSIEQWIECPPAKERKTERPKRPNDPLSKYTRDQVILSRRGDPGATPEQKIAEIKQFHKKAKKDREGIMYFGFKYLGLSEQMALLEEIGIQSQISEKISKS